MPISSTEYESKTSEELIKWAMDQYGLKAGLACSFGMEDMVLIDMIAKLKGPITIFTLDTGRLHEETYQIMDRVRSHYGLEIKTYFPNSEKVEKLVREKGFFSFKESIDNRKECCAIRKIEPLNRALDGLEAWVTGLRRDQAVTRTETPKVLDDLDHPPLVKINPLADWTQEQVETYIEDQKVPVNALHKKNYPSIGCAPCTRPIEPGEDVRAGRWWWENPEHKECGLHPRN
ncbi:MAG: phosphoadenylyl-sulfate reductase [Nitrospinota bacterium]